MPKKACARTLVGSEHVKGTKTLLKYAQQYLYHIFWSLWEKMCSKNSVLVVSEILRQLVNILTPDDKYTLSRNQFKCIYLEIQKYLLNFFLHFWNLHKTWNTLEKKLNLLGHWFLKI